MDKETVVKTKWSKSDLDDKNLCLTNANGDVSPAQLRVKREAGTEDDYNLLVVEIVFTNYPSKTQVEWDIVPLNQQTVDSFVPREEKGLTIFDGRLYL